MNNSKFGDTIRKLRKGKELTLKTVAEAIGCSVSYLSDVESSRRAPFNHKDTVKLAKVLGVSSGKLHAAAAITRGHFELPVRDDIQEAQTLGAILQSKWNVMKKVEFRDLVSFFHKD